MRQPNPKQVERHRKRLRQQRKLFLSVAAVVSAVVLVIVGWSALSNSSLFKIEHLQVKGNSRLSEEEVLTQLSLPANATLLGIDEDEIARKLAANTWIAGVSVKRKFPSTLVVEVTERVPVARVDTGVTLWFVDADARILAESVADTSTVLPVIRDLPDFVAEPGKASGSETLRNALAVLRGLDSQLTSSVRIVSAPSRNETALLTSGNVEIMVGEAVSLKEKSILIQDILRQRGADVVFIDVRSTERPVSRGLGQ